MSSAQNDVDIFVFDIETVPDIELLRAVKFSDDTDIPDEELYSTWKQQQERDGESTFLPVPFHLPLAIGLCKVGKDLSLRDVLTIHAGVDGEPDPEAITRRFWEGWYKYSGPTLVTYNGRAFDIPVLEFGAFRYGTEYASHWFSQEGPGYAHPRNRFNMKAHFDCQEFLTNFGGQRIPGGLNMFTKFVGGAGKMGIDGSQVYRYWREGRMSEIIGYAACDALDTYLVYLRCEVLRGTISLAQERKLRDAARDTIEQIDSAALREYLKQATL